MSHLSRLRAPLRMPHLSRLRAPLRMPHLSRLRAPLRMPRLSRGRRRRRRRARAWRTPLRRALARRLHAFTTHTTPRFSAEVHLTLALGPVQHLAPSPPRDMADMHACAHVLPGLSPLRCACRRPAKGASVRAWKLVVKASTLSASTDRKTALRTSSFSETQLPVLVKV